MFQWDNPTKSLFNKNPIPKKELIRSSIVANAYWGVQHNKDIHYAEMRPIPVTKPPHTLPFTTDCSGFVTLCCLWSGAPDPNGLKYSGMGYTGTMLDHLPEIKNWSAVLPGDLIVYGSGTGHHVVIVVKTNPYFNDFAVVSHGSENGPLVTTHREEVAGQPHGVRVLRVI